MYLMAIWADLQPFYILNGHLVILFFVIWYISPVLVYCTKKNIVTLPGTNLIVW
jgi:hypothetical protein